MFQYFRKDKLLSTLSTLGIGGLARYFIEVRTIDEMQDVISFAHHEQLPFIVIGKGSNILFDSDGFDGLVILNKIDFCEEKKPGQFYVGAGYSFALLGRNTAKHGWSGLEFASGIPASVGGAIYMNAGAQKCETKEYLHSVDYITEEGTKVTLSMQECAFGYRTSIFQEMSGAIVAGEFHLQYNSEASLLQKQMLDVRIHSQPYSDKSAGCVFRNPPGKSAGAIIDSLGLKGFRIGGAQVSQVHANFLINAHNASSDEFKELIEYIKERVREKEGIDLETEVRMIPYRIDTCTKMEH